MFDFSFSVYNRKTICYLIEGILKSRTVNLKDAVTKVSYGASVDSLYRRFQRLFQKEMEFCGIGLFLLKSFLKMCFIALHRPIRIYLSIDRHEWSYGSKVNNLLVAHVFEPITGIDFPVSVIDLDRRGNSSTLNRGDLLSHLLPYLQQYLDDGRLSITVLGDREFFSHDWLDELASRGIEYIIRLKRDYTLPNDKNVADVYERLDINDIVAFRNGEDIVVIKKLKSVKGRRDSCLAILSNLDNTSFESVLDEYSIRWKIERAFFNIESNGWQLKKTHLKAAKRVEMMFYILSLCYYISVVFGHVCIALGRLKKKKHGYASITRFLRGRRFIDELFTRYHVVSFDDLYECLCNFILQILSDIGKLDRVKGVV